MEARERDESDCGDQDVHHVTLHETSEESESGSDLDDMPLQEVNDESDHAESDAEWEREMELRGTVREFTIPHIEWEEFKSGIHTTRLVTKWMPHLFVRTTRNEIGGGQILQSDYWDETGTGWAGLCWPATERVFSAKLKEDRKGIAFECTNAEGPGTITVYNQHGGEMDGRYWTRQVLGIWPNSAYEFSKSNGAIPRCIRQLKMSTLEEMARFFRTDLLSTLAYYCRTPHWKLNVKGHISHLFAKELADPNECVYVTPMPRGKLEGVTLIRIDGSDYSLKTGKRVGYERVGEVYEVVEEGGSVERIDDDALVG